MPTRPQASRRASAGNGRSASRRESRRPASLSRSRLHSGGSYRRCVLACVERASAITVAPHEAAPHDASELASDWASEDAPQEAVPQDAVPQDADDHAAAPQEAAPQDAAPQEAAPQEAASHDWFACAVAPQLAALKTGIEPPFGSG